ncbi:MAG: hypothetical protein V8Q30_09175 [Acutalibacteraceae bacterium]
MTDPEKNYLLEFTVYRAGLVEPLAALLEQVVGMPKFQLRRDQAVLYYRESENIEDALTAAGAPKSAMELMEVKIVLGYAQQGQPGDQLRNGEYRQDGDRFGPADCGY